MNYNGKTFKILSKSENGETYDTIFYYQQDGNIITSSYKGGIISGHLIGFVGSGGGINMRYHQINSNGELMTGTCVSNRRFLR